MIYLQLFLAFFKIGIVTFGGGYAMIPLIRETVLTNNWMSEELLLNMIAVSESTPGPVAINMATFVGSSQAGILGSACATLGVVLPSFIIILLISSVIKNFLKYTGVKAFLSGVRPCVVALILATAVNLFISTLLGFKNFDAISFSPDYKGLGIFAVILLVAFLSKKLANKNPPPILMILFSAVMGMIVYSL